jgi:hypothetical protein
MKGVFGKIISTLTEETNIYLLTDCKSIAYVRIFFHAYLYLVDNNVLYVHIPEWISNYEQLVYNIELRKQLCELKKRLLNQNLYIENTD